MPTWPDTSFGLKSQGISRGKKTNRKRMKLSLKFVLFLVLLNFTNVVESSSATVKGSMKDLVDKILEQDEELNILVSHGIHKDVQKYFNPKKWNFNNQTAEKILKALVNRCGEILVARKNNILYSRSLRPSVVEENNNDLQWIDLRAEDFEDYEWELLENFKSGEDPVMNTVHVSSGRDNVPSKKSVRIAEEANETRTFSIRSATNEFDQILNKK